MSYGVKLWGWEKKEVLEKMMIDYVRQMFKLDFYTPRYIIIRELKMDKLKIKQKLRAMRFEERIISRGRENILKNCWKEKEMYEWKDAYSKERKKLQQGWMGNMGNISIEAI